jgi:Flp pilus assembly protein TadB
MTDVLDAMFGSVAVGACAGVACLVLAGRSAAMRRRLGAICPLSRPSPGTRTAPASDACPTSRAPWAPLTLLATRFSSRGRESASPQPDGANTARSLLAGSGTTLAGLLCFGAKDTLAMLGWLLVGAAVGAVVNRRERAAIGAERSRLTAAQAPLAADLFAACVTAGARPAEAAASVARVLDGDIARHFGAVAAALRLGVEPMEAWRPLASDAATEPLARALGRGCRTGAPLAEIASLVAVDLRAARRDAARIATRQAGTRAMAPLGGCFLPAFVLLAVVPMIAGLVSRLPL